MDTATPPAAPSWLKAITALLVLWAAWWLMMVSHEAGHVIAAWLSGARISRIDLSPAGFSQTHLATNPHPLLVVWAGPVAGVLDPLLAWGLAAWLGRRDKSWRYTPLFAFLAGFCLLANGVYIGLGWIDRIGDTGDMLRLGTPVWVMVNYGLLCSLAGLAAWHRLGPKLWLSNLSSRVATELLCASAAVVLLGFLTHLALK